jgi:hypothetical protein
MRSFWLALVLSFTLPCVAQHPNQPINCAHPTLNNNHMIGGGTSPLGRTMGGDKCVHRCAQAVVIQPKYPRPVPPGVPIPFTVQIASTFQGNGLLGGVSEPDGGTTKLCYAGGDIDYGDGKRDQLYVTGFINPCNHQQTGYLTEPINETFTHTFPVTGAPEADYCVSVKIFGDYAYSADDGSCSYECMLQFSMPVTVSKGAKLPRPEAPR